MSSRFDRSKLVALRANEGRWRIEAFLDGAGRLGDLYAVRAREGVRRAVKSRGSGQKRDWDSVGRDLHTALEGSADTTAALP